MINRPRSIRFPSFAVGLLGSLATVWSIGPSRAHADFGACGNIFLTGDASCEYRPKEECMTECMTTAVETACVTQVYQGCETSCTTTASTECESACTTSCVDQCTTTTTAEKGPSCMDLCLGDCEADDDDGYCGNSKHRGPCSRCAKHTCERRCEEKCGDAAEQTQVKTVTECMPTCTNACSASCTAKVNTQCQVDCQDSTYTQCEQQMIQTCQTKCKDKGGAIFCDGQFVNADNAGSCADELRAKIDIDIDIKDVGDSVSDAAGSVGKKVDDTCSVLGVGMGTSGGLGVLAPLAAFAMFQLRRRRPGR